MSEADTLKDLVDSQEDDSAAIQQSIDSVDEQIAEETEKQDAFYYTMDQACNQIIDFLVPGKGDMVAEYGNFRITNATDWYVADAILDNSDVDPNNNITYISGTEFTCQGDQAASFPIGDTILFTGVDSTTAVFSTITDSVYDSTAHVGVTYVEVADSVITAGVDRTGVLSYEYGGVGWDSDTDIEDRKADFDYAYDHIVQPLGFGGTYGTMEMIATLQSSKGLLQSNQGKVDARADRLGRYSS